MVSNAGFWTHLGVSCKSKIPEGPVCRFDLEPVEIHSKGGPGIRVEEVSGIQA
jgi:hypothetical protein